jgi:hypothetical protein
MPSTPHRSALASAALAILTFCSAACLAAGNDRYGRTYYIDGAGNWGFGVTEVTEGLTGAGYNGRTINWRWSPTLNPALDQTIGRPFARARGAELGKEITKYLAKYPGNQVNIICLSAGTGVGVWACEHVKPPAKVHNLIMLGSSVSSDYDMSKALANIDGRVYVYYASGDLICQGAVRTLGTIDGKFGVEPTGLVGLHPRGVKTDKIVNIGWSAKYEQYGWTGTHTDATSEPFVRLFLSKHVLPEPANGGAKKESAGVAPPPPAQVQMASAGAPTTQPH